MDDRLGAIRLGPGDYAPPLGGIDGDSDTPQRESARCLFLDLLCQVAEPKVRELQRSLSQDQLDTLNFYVRFSQPGLVPEFARMKAEERALWRSGIRTVLSCWQGHKPA